MHATICRYERVHGTTEELSKVTRQACSNLRQTTGFVACFILASEPDVIAAVCIFEDQNNLKEAEILISDSMRDLLSVTPSEKLQVTTGEIIFQKGL